LNAFEAIAETLHREGGYVNDPKDKGGATNFGITQATARRHGYTGDMKDFPITKAAEIYKAEYWDSPKIGDLSNVAPTTAFHVFDFGVNAGPGTSVEILQTALNALTGKVQPVDGLIGPSTIEAAKSVKDDALLANTVKSLQVLHYLKLAESEPSQHRFLHGWLNRVFA